MEPALKQYLLPLIGVLLLAGCVNYAAKLVQDRDLTNTSWQCGGVLTLQFVNYDIVDFYNHGGDVDAGGKSSYVPVPAKNFYFYSDYPESESFDANPPLVFAPKEKRIGTWSLSNHILTLNFEVQDVSTLPLISYRPDIQKSYAVSYQGDYLGNEEMVLQDADWSPLFAPQ
jgi:hypothetical protein